MKKLFCLCTWAIVAMSLVSCSANFEQLLEEGKYKEAEKCIMRMKGLKKYTSAEVLINEYIELENYDRPV